MRERDARITCLPERTFDLLTTHIRMIKRIPTRFRVHIKNLLWAAAEYVSLPLLNLLATPIFIKTLGTAGFALWMLALSVSGMAGIAGLGMSSAAMKYVAEFRGRGEHEAVAGVIRQTLCIALCGGAIVAGCISLCAPLLARHAFPAMGEFEEVTAVIIGAAVLLFISQADSVFAAAIKGFERFDLGARLDMAIKFLFIAITIAAAVLTQKIFVVIAAALAVASLGLVARATLACRVVGASVFLPRWEPSLAREVLQFGVWNWLQGIASSLFTYFDRLLIASTLGAVAMAHYSICTQLASQVHSIPAAGLSALLPLASRKLGENRATDMARINQLSVLVNVVFALLLALPLWSFSKEILSLWIGSEIAGSSSKLLFWMTLVYFLLSLSVAPYYLLLAQGQARFVSIVNLSGGVVTTIAALVLIPVFGLIGGVLARSFYLPILSLTFLRLSWRKLS